MDPTLALGQFATLTGGAALVLALVEVIKRTLAWSDATTSRFAPLTSLIIGVAMMLLVAVGTGGVTNAVESLFAGIVVGLYSCGLYSIAGKPVIVAAVGPAHPEG